MTLEELNHQLGQVKNEEQKNKAQAHQGPPPGWLTTTGAAKALGISRQAFYQSKLNQDLESWKMGSVVLYRQEDVEKLAAERASR